jgi:hypothetical protein
MTEQKGPDPDVLRAEAEKLVAAGLAAVSVAADRIGAPTRERGGAAAAGYDALGDMLFGPASHRRHSVANDSPECCRCPVCRVISAARQPSPVFAERLATGVGFMAGSAARVLRGFAGAASAVRQPRADVPEGDPWSVATTPVPVAVRQPRAVAAEGDPWSAATAEPPAAPAAAMAAAPVPPDPKKAVKKTARKAVKKAVAKQAVAKTAKKTVAKKAVKKAAPRRAEGGGSVAGTGGQ